MACFFVGKSGGFAAMSDKGRLPFFHPAYYENLSRVKNGAKSTPFIILY